MGLRRGPFGLEVVSQREEIKVRLTADELDAGLHALNRNARRLLVEATHLYGMQRYSTAVMLGMLAIEESLKWRVMLGTLSFRQRDVRDAWIAAARHDAKLTRMAELYNAILKTIEGTFQVEPTSIATTYQRLKMRCTYVSFVEGREWTEPSAVCNAEAALIYVRHALLCVCGPMRMTACFFTEIFEEVRWEDEAEERMRRDLVEWGKGAVALERHEENERENARIRDWVDARLK